MINSSVPVVKKSTSPVIIIGLPRSGSSYLTHIFSCLDNWFVFDDLYPYQKANSLGIHSSLNLVSNEKLLKKYINQLTWQLRAKIKFEQNFDFPNLSWEDTYEMEKAIFESLQKNDNIFWSDVLEEWITRLALFCGKHRWGYKTPQDFMHMEELTKIFPGVKFIYIVRDPRKVLQSYKNLPRVKTHGSQDGVHRQYHPVIYSWYWKNSYKTVQAFIKQNLAAVEIVKFEDLIKNPQLVADRIANFLNASVSGKVTIAQGNSSLKQGSERKLTNLEINICEKIVGSCMEQAGYKFSRVSSQFSEIFDLLDTSFTFTIYQLERIIKDKKSRGSIFTFIKRLFKKESDD